MEFAIRYFCIQTIENDAIMECYAVIDAYADSIGRPMGKNDVWIAATAMALNCELLTTDRDFDHLEPTFLTRRWIDPRQP